MSSRVQSTIGADQQETGNGSDVRPQPALVAGDEARGLMLPRVQPDRWLRALALGVAVFIHAAALALALPRQPDRLGDGGTELEAIAVEIVMTAPVAAGAPDVASHATVEDSAQPSAVDSSPPAAAPTPKPVETAETEPRPLTETEAQPEPQSEPEPEPVTPRPVDAEPPVPEQAEPLPPPASAKVPEPPPLEAKSASAREPVEVKAAAPPPSPPPQPAAAAPPPRAAVARQASVGVMRAYARKVALALVRAKPKGTGVRGTVRLRFMVGPNGRAIDVALVKSSGSRRLDSAAQAAIGRISFPVPPADASADQRTFVVPYDFR